MSNIFDHELSRRSFLQKSALLTAASGLAVSGVAPVIRPLQAQAAGGLTSIKPQNKALVFIMLDGGNDSFNMLVPISSPHYEEYSKTRANLAIDKRDLIPLKNFHDKEGRHFSLHPSMPETAELFHRGKLSFIANIGPMITPITKEEFHSGGRLPLGLLSHADQFKHWQTARADQRLNRGWFGSFADMLQPDRAIDRIPMNISLAGSNIMQNGVGSSHYTITEEGSIGLVVNEIDNALNRELLRSFENLLTKDYGRDPFSRTYLSQTREAQAQHEAFRDATITVPVQTEFSSTPLSAQLRKVAQTIYAAEALGHAQQTFFIRYIGWDHHDELLNNQRTMLSVLSRALGEFQAALHEMGLEERVVTFTGSDFGRTLTSNGNGTDHGWGGNTIVMGSAIQGGRVFGNYPRLGLGDENPLDVGSGVLIPTTPLERLYAELAVWFGLEPAGARGLFPNLANFDHTMYPALRLFGS